MMMRIRVVLSLASLAGSASGFAPSASRTFGVTALSMAAPKKAEKVVLVDIVDTAVAAGSFSTLAAALGAADLVDTLKGVGPFTVFAPTDEAFAKLPEGTVADLLKPENKAKLASILTYHVLSGEVMASTVVTMDGKSAETVNGASVTIGVKDGVVTVDDATVVTTDIKTSNGVIHVIDSVMIPK
jgi:transforming growth factor-beta-induced protein